MTTDPPPAGGHAASDAAAPAAPHIDLGADLTPLAFAPGRYAVAIQRSMQGTHAAMRIREDATASFVLELTADGHATACRGWRYNGTNDGPNVHTEDRFREQRGFRGTYVVKDGVATVDLALDETVCPSLGEYLNGTPGRATALGLRCVLASPHGHPSLTADVLLCQWTPVGEPTPEIDAYRVADLVPDPWLVLGGGKGVRIKVTGKAAGARTGDPVKAVVTIPDAAIAFDAWTQSF